MRDDSLQGILFNRSPVVDLVQYKRRQRLAKKILAQKTVFIKWGRHRRTLLQSLHSSDSAQMIKHQQEVDELLSRLKIPSNDLLDEY